MVNILKWNEISEMKWNEIWLSTLALYPIRSLKCRSHHYESEIWKWSVYCRYRYYSLTFWTLFSFSSGHNTRSNCLYRLPKPRTNAMRRTFFYSVIDVWNSLSDSLKNSSSISVVKRDFIKSQLEQYSADNFTVFRLY